MDPNAGAGQFIFQTVDWPAIPITMLFWVDPTSPAPIASRPTPEGIRRFALNLATSRGEVEDCVRRLVHSHRFDWR